MIRPVRVATTLAGIALLLAFTGCGSEKGAAQPESCPADLAAIEPPDEDGEGVDVAAPSWSPDGSRIAFSTGTSLFLLTVADCSIERVRPAREGLRVDWADWSPDGTSFAFIGSSDTDTEAVFVMRADGSGVRRVAEPASALFPVWSPDGRTIAFVDDRFDKSSGTEDRNVWLVDADGTSLRRVTKGTWHGSVGWSPDGEWLVTDSGSAVVRVRPDGSERTVVVGGDHPSPDWSPDGKTLVMQGLSFAPATGGAPRTVDVVQDGAFEPAWSPDGEWIAFVDGSGAQDLWIGQPDGDGLRQLTQAPDG
jgi:Tol biopolymer transport system component